MSLRELMEYEELAHQQQAKLHDEVLGDACHPRRIRLNIAKEYVKFRKRQLDSVCGCHVCRAINAIKTLRLAVWS